MSTGTQQSWLELHARSGRAVLVDDGTEIDPSRLRLPDGLVRALHEWAQVADTVTHGEAEEDSAAVVARRGRQLATRLALETGGEVGYVDPLSGRLARVGRGRAATALAEVGPKTDPQQPPTPWATGLTVSAVIAAITAIVLVVVSTGLGEVNVFLAFAVNLAVAAGFAPSIWLGRNVLVWRWVAFGAAAGIVLAWLALLLNALG